MASRIKRLFKLLYNVTSIITTLRLAKKVLKRLRGKR